MEVTLRSGFGWRAAVSFWSWAALGCESADVASLTMDAAVAMGDGALIEDGAMQSDAGAFPGGDSGTTWLAGRAQKGPFVSGTTVGVGELDETLTQTGRRFDGVIDDDVGSFSIPAVMLQSPFVRIATEGFYFDEVRGALSDSPLALFSYADVSDTSAVNLNLLGHLEAGRIERLVRDERLPFADAKQQAHAEVLAIFTFDATDVGAAETLDLASEGIGNGMFLALSIILQGTRTVGELTELLSAIQNDLAEDGVLDDVQSRSALMNGARTVNRARIRENLEARFAALSVEATVPNFEGPLQQFIDEAGYDFTAGITYPDDGTRPNVLDPLRTTFQSGRHRFAAMLPPVTELAIRVRRTSGAPDGKFFFNLPPADWMFPAPTEDELADPNIAQTFTAAHDGLVSSDEFMLAGTGSARIEYFEYGSTTPSFAKDVTWTP